MTFARNIMKGCFLAIRLMCYFVAFLLGLNLLGIVGFRYIRLVENQPLNNPIQVEVKEGNSLRLEDGRNLELSQESNEIYLSLDGRSLSEHFSDTPKLIEIRDKKDLSSDFVEIWGLKRRFICG